MEAPKDKKKKAQTKQQDGAFFEVQLQDTVLFPEGGGQPSDIGHINSQDGHCWDVLEVKRHGAQAIHYVKGDPEATLQSLVAGARVTVALGEEGFKRRYDHVRSWIFSSHRLVLTMYTTLSDVYTHLSTFDIRAPRNALEFANSILVSNAIS
jgi:Ser-tRNA(Ala) deacylase AlaX